MKKLVFALVVITVFSCKKEQPEDERLSAQTLTDISYGNDAQKKMDVYYLQVEVLTAQNSS